MVEIGKIISAAVTIEPDDEVSIANLRKRSLALCEKHPLYQE